MENIEGEIWKDINTIPYYQAGWPFHQVSNKGRIRALPGGKVAGGRLTIKTELRILTPRKGYMTVKQNERILSVHVLVLNQFFGPCPQGQECRHLNGNRSDNRWPENLKWGTTKENSEDRDHHMMTAIGERHGRSVFTESDISNIRNSSESSRQLALRYKVSHVAILNIRNGHTWKHVK